MKTKLFYQCLAWLNAGLITPEEMIRLQKEPQKKYYVLCCGNTIYKNSTNAMFVCPSCGFDNEGSKIREEI